MKQRIKPTHFIEQFNAKGKYKCGRGYYHTYCMTINLLHIFLAETRSQPSLHTVAIFKIRLKS